MDWRRVGAGVAAVGTLAGGGTVAVDAEINPYEVTAEIEAHRDRPAVTLSKWMATQL